MEWFDAWIDQHAEAFALVEADKAAMMAWEPVFTAACITRAELQAATAHLVGHPELLAGELRFLSRAERHLAALRRRVRECRALTYRQEVDRHEHAAGVCSLCGGTGRVIVPHPACVSGGEWVPLKATRHTPHLYTLAVFCRCGLGRWVQSRVTVPEGRRLLTLDEYEADNPRWRVQWERHRRERVAETRLTPATGKAGAAFEQAKQRLAAAWNMPPMES